MMTTNALSHLLSLVHQVKISEETRADIITDKIRLDDHLYHHLARFLSIFAQNIPYYYIVCVCVICILLSKVASISLLFLSELKPFSHFNSQLLSHRRPRHFNKTGEKKKGNVCSSAADSITTYT